MRILAIDGATLKVGYAVIDCNSGKDIQLVTWGTLECSGDLHKRLEYLQDKVLKLIEDYEPDQVAVEDLKFSKYAYNFAALTKVAYAIGAVLVAFSKAGMTDIFSIPANSVRKKWDVKQTKSALRAAVSKKFLVQLQTQNRPTGFKKSDEDATDAIGLAVVAYPYFKEN